MASATGSGLSIPDPPTSNAKLFSLAKSQLLTQNSLYLKNVRSDVAGELITALYSDPSIGGEMRYRYNFEGGLLTAFMPTPLHISIQRSIQDILWNMCSSGYLSRAQSFNLTFLVGTDCKSFTGQYAGTFKQPDLRLLSKQRSTPKSLKSCPVWVNETGWSESTRPHVDRSMEAWLAGTDYGVLLAIEINYTRRSGSRAVAGYVRFHSNRGTRVGERSIFPPPMDPDDDKVSFTRGELFGDALPLETGQTLEYVFIWDIGILRAPAEDAFQDMGLTSV